jgi:hypothetical protein
VRGLISRVASMHDRIAFGNDETKIHANLY